MTNIVKSTFTTGNGTEGQFYSLPALAEGGYPQLHRLPVSIRIVLESLLRNCDGLKVTEKDVANLAAWNAKNPGSYEIPFTVARIVLQDLTGVPLLVDLAAMRSAVAGLGKDASVIEPLVPVDLVVDHSVQVDWAGCTDALEKNLDIEFTRNAERYEFLKWGQQAFKTFSVVPPSVGIVHQVNLEYLAQGVMEKDGVFFPDTLVGTDSHTTMINGIGVVGWGVGGIEAEAGMLGQPVTFLVPEVVGVHMTGALREGVTATDLALHVTKMLRAHGVVGKFVEFFGEGAAALTLADRATVANMAPEYGATMGFFPMDERCSEYLRQTGRSNEAVITYENYFKAQGLWGMPKQGELDYSVQLELDLATVQPAVSGPRRPQDHICLDTIRESFHTLVKAPIADGGYAKSDSPEVKVTMKSPAGVPTPVEGYNQEATLKDGSILIAAITSCTNTSNPGLMLAAGLLAKKAVAFGLKVPAHVKTSIAPGSRIASNYYKANDLQDALNTLGFATVGYGCTTCIGNSGPLNPDLEQAVRDNNIVAAAVLSGNRNFEARIHASIKTNFLMSPPLVVAFALAGRVDIDFATEALGYDSKGKPVYLKDIWPSSEEISAAIAKANNPDVYRELYTITPEKNPRWTAVRAPEGAVFRWNTDSTYIQEPPFFNGFDGKSRTLTDIVNARPLGIFGNSVTTDHISPAGAIKESGPAGVYLQSMGVVKKDFNSFGSRRGNDRVMTRGTFANVRIKNTMVGGVEGGYTLYFGDADVPAPDCEITAESGKPTFIYDAAMAYAQENTPLVVIGGEDYGMGSSRDWAAKGTNLLGVQAVITKSFERIHRSNLIGMGVLPLNFVDKADYDRIAPLKDVYFSIIGLSNDFQPRQQVTLRVQPAGADAFEVPVIIRIDTPIEKEYYLSGGILQYVLTQILK
ncbi:MAG: aconitate hydratase AcnA [Akkermansia sp.]|nr:aconitate hydratase AcnA [Akkermansia sp.]